jgi:hypothetical protein
MRADGSLVRNQHPIRRIMPFVMPTRNGAFVLFEQQIPTAPLRAALERVNAGRPPERAVTLFHCVLRGLGIALTEFPRLNRFVAGRRLYERHGVWLAFSGKQRLERDAALFTAKVAFEARDGLAGLADRVYAQLGTARSGRETHEEHTIKTYLRLPGPLLRLGVRLQRAIDALGLMPGKMIEDDALYASVFVANLGSVGLDAVYHHLYEYGSIPIFVTMGRVHRTPVVRDDGAVVSEEVFTLRYTYDERIEDGFYAARALERMAAALADPAAVLGADAGH